MIKTANVNNINICILCFCRYKAFNLCQVVRMVVEILSPYLEARLTNLMLGKQVQHPRCERLINMEKSYQLTNNIYRVPSGNEKDKWYDVNVDIGCCTCLQGANGKMCKHQYSVLVHYLLERNYCYKGTPQEKQRWIFIALGKEKTPHLEFFFQFS